MPDLHCPSCRERLPASAFELLILKHKVDITIELDQIPEHEEDLISSSAEGEFRLKMSCMKCPWWGELELGSQDPVINIEVTGGFDSLKKLILMADGLSHAGISMSYAAEYGKA